MDISPQDIRRAAEIALALEPLLDKQDCTTRYHDLKDKPLTDFVIAGINVGAVIEQAAQEMDTKQAGMFTYFEQALRVSNKYKSKKLINTGLLHFLFITMAVRLHSHSLTEALDNYLPVMQATSTKDVLDFIRAMKYSWDTSAKKNEWIRIREQLAPSVHSYYELQKTISDTAVDFTSSSYQVTKQASEGFPLIRKYIQAIDEQKGLVKSIEDAYTKVRAEHSDIKVGVLADLSASAMFLYLSYQDPEKYIIH